MRYERANRFDYAKQIRPDIKAALDAYANGRRPVGGFLTAVLSNDLAEACARADEQNLWSLPVIVGYVWNHLPSGCWGSPEKVAAWRRHESAAELEADLLKGDAIDASAERAAEAEWGKRKDGGA